MFENVFLIVIIVVILLLIVVIGELVVECFGVFNLGVEGMMIMGVVIGFVVVN